MVARKTSNLEVVGSSPTSSVDIIIFVVVLDSPGVSRIFRLLPPSLRCHEQFCDLGHIARLVLYHTEKTRRL